MHRVFGEQTYDCPECRELEERQRERAQTLAEDVLKLRTGLARLAFKAGLDEYVPGKPGREAPFEKLCEVASQQPRGWNALIARLMDRVEAPVPAEPERHTPGCESWQGKACSCPPYSFEG